MGAAIDQPFSRLLKAAREEEKDFPRLLNQASTLLEERNGIQAAYNLVLRLQAALNLRKPTLAIYDHTFHIIGGGEKYGLTVAQALKNDFDITILASRPISQQNIQDWYQLDLSACRIKIIPIPFFEESGSIHLDPARINRRMPNPFHLISRESGHYDFFINNGMNEMVFPLANVSAMIVHFPERRPTGYFYADRYTAIIYNSRYTAQWIEKKWKFPPHHHIYPPVDMAPGAGKMKKEKIIISVARFEPGGSKKQLEMVRTFAVLKRSLPGLLSGWRLVLAGGSLPDNPYLERIKEYITTRQVEDIEFKINIAADELKALYRKAAIFWHLCGLDQSDPALVEHFGMTIAEAMQNRAAPIVFDGGGQREIVEHGISGFRVKSTAGLIHYTRELIEKPSLLEEIGRKAGDKSQVFTRQRFEERVRDFFLARLKEYLTGAPPGQEAG